MGIDITEEMLKNGKRIKDLSNVELIALKNNKSIHNSTYSFVMEEYNYRLCNKFIEEKGSEQ